MESIEVHLEEEYLTEDTVCSICNAEFLDLEDLEIHVKQVHSILQTNEEEIVENPGKKCDFCTQNYTDLQNYADHIRDEHILGPSEVNFCRYCLRGFRDGGARGRHEKKHLLKLNKNSINISCWKCSKKSVIEVIRDHDKIHRQEDEGVFIQDLLPFLSASFHVKASVVIESMSVYDSQLHCIGCGFKTEKLQLLADHAKKKSCKCYICYKCSNVYKRKTALIRHIVMKCSLSAKLCMCCHKTIASSKYLEHKQICKNYKCQKCSETFVNLLDYSYHQSEAHTLAVELQSCNFCWKQCIGERTLQKHIDKSHKPYFHLYKYRCVDCDKVFQHPQKLFGHYFTTHKELTPYHCKICDIKFRIRKQFTLHIKLKHNSKGFVEFDEKYHVFFDDRKSEQPFIPKSIYTNDKFDKIEDKGHSDIINDTETEANQTETEVTPSKPKLKRKKLVKRKRDNSLSSDDEPLQLLKKRSRKSARNQNSVKIKPNNVARSQLICKICNKYCYTVQNYDHHVSLHSKTKVKCIKCSKVFKSKKKLKHHVETHHSSSKLTETLKTLLEKRKIGQTLYDQLPNCEKFRRTIKKSQSDTTPVNVTISETENRLSVQKFIENFTPDTDVRSSSDALTCKIVTEKREPFIKLTKFKPHPLKPSSRLAMPVKYKDNYEKVEISINILSGTKNYKEFNLDLDSNEDLDRNDSIPDIAEEIETVTEAPKNPPVQHQIIIPNIPKDIKNLSIAHLQPEAPFFKIVKVNDYLGGETKIRAPVAVSSNDSPIKLPDGTKLVNANPLAHLLGTFKIDETLKTKKKKAYYTSKNAHKSFQEIFAQALSKLEGKKKKVKKENDEAVVPNEEVENENEDEYENVEHLEEEDGPQFKIEYKPDK